MRRLYSDVLVAQGRRTIRTAVNLYRHARPKASRRRSYVAITPKTLQSPPLLTIKSNRIDARTSSFDSKSHEVEGKNVVIADNDNEQVKVESLSV